MAESKFAKGGFYPTNDFPNVIPGEAGREVRFELEAKERKSMDVNIFCKSYNEALRRFHIAMLIKDRDNDFR